MRMRSVGLLYSFGRLLRIVFIDDPGLKLICVVLATLMWFYIDGELMSQERIRIADEAAAGHRIEGRFAGDSRRKPGSLPKFKVIVRGPRRQFEFWPRENLHFKRKLLENPQPGRNSIHCRGVGRRGRRIQLSSPSSPKDPGGASVDLVAMATQMKNVRVRIRNEPKEQFLVGKPIAEPAQVRVKGTIDDLAAISEVWTEEVDLAGAEQKIANVEVPIAETHGYRRTRRLKSTATKKCA